MKNLKKLLLGLAVYFFAIKETSFANRRNWTGLSVSHSAGAMFDISGTKSFSNSYSTVLINDLEFGFNITKNFYLGGEFEIQNLSLKSFWPGIHAAYTTNKYLVAIGTSYLATGIKGMFRYSINNRLAIETKLNYFWPLVGNKFLRSNFPSQANYLNLSLGINFKLI